MKKPYDRNDIRGKELKSVKLNDRETLTGELFAINEVFVTQDGQQRSFFTALILGEDKLLYSLVGNFVFDKKLKYLRGLENIRGNRIIVARSGLTNPGTNGKQYDNYFIRVITPVMYTESKPQQQQAQQQPQQTSYYGQNTPSSPPPDYQYNPNTGFYDDEIPF